MIKLELIYDVNIDSFCEWLIAKIQKYFLSQIDSKRAAKFDEYINQIIRWKFIPKRISTVDLLRGSIYNLKYTKMNNKYIIEIDPNIYIPDTYNRYIEIVRLVNYGNLSLSAYPIYNNVFKYFDDNALSYFQEYQEE